MNQSYQPLEEEGKETDGLNPSKYGEVNQALGLHGREKETESQKIVWVQRKNR